MYKTNIDKQAFELSYDKYKDKIYSYLWNILNYNSEDATNVLSDVFIKFYEYNKKQKIENPRSLLYKMAHNLAIDLIRTRKSEDKNSFDDAKLELVTDKADVCQKDDINTSYKQDLLRKIMLQLDKKHRESVYLYFYEQKSYDEIADIV
jgi:RNA polymerase sigma-70 factor (ECF subfamily)